VTETHAWYDGEEKDAKLRVTTLDPQATEGLANLEEAWRRYNEQVRRRGSDGFVHSFYIEIDSNTLGPVYKYRYL
jgi:hypothetical protein